MCTYTIIVHHVLRMYLKYQLYIERRSWVIKLQVKKYVFWPCQNYDDFFCFSSFALASPRIIRQSNLFACMFYELLRIYYSVANICNCCGCRETNYQKWQTSIHFWHFGLRYCHHAVSYIIIDTLFKDHI